MAATRYLEKLVVHTFPSGSGKQRDSSYLADGEFGDLNKGWDGTSWAYVEPIWTTRPEDAASYVDVLIGGKKSGKGKDYAYQCKGHKYRYITVRKEPNRKIIDVRLVDKRLAGYQNSRDINENRGGRSLFIAYRWAPDENLKEGFGTLSGNNYHGDPARGNRFWVFAPKYELDEPEWDTYLQANEFCTNCKYIGTTKGVRGHKVYQCLGHNNIDLKNIRWRTVCGIPSNTEKEITIQVGFKTEKRTEQKRETETTRNITWNVSSKVGASIGWFSAEVSAGFEKSDGLRKLSTRLESFSEELTKTIGLKTTYKEVDKNTTVIQAVIVGWCKKENKEYLLGTHHVLRVDALEDRPALPALSQLL